MNVDDKTATQQTLQQLAQATIPAAFDNLLAGIEKTLAEAQQTIDQSLAQSSALINQSRQALLQSSSSQSSSPQSTSPQNKSLHQGSPDVDTPGGSADGPAESPVQPSIDGAVDGAIDDAAQTEQTLLQSVDQHQSAAHQAAVDAETAMMSTMKGIEESLKAQHQAYQQVVLQSHQQASLNTIEAVGQVPSQGGQQ